MPIRIPIAAGIAAIFLTSVMTLAQIRTLDLQNKAMVRREMMAFNPRYPAPMLPRYRALQELEHR
jgi:hypothetical protein